MTDVGPIGRLGRCMAQHFALVATAWVVVERVAHLRSAIYTDEEARTR